MNRAARNAVLVLALLAGKGTLAAECDWSPVAGVSGVFGGRGGSGGDDSVLFGAAFSGGFRWTSLRAGFVVRVVSSRSFGSAPAVDFGGFFAADLFSVWLDPQISLAAFLRLDALSRDVASHGVNGFASYLSIGLRLIGFELAIAAGPEGWLRLGPRVEPGGSFEFRLGLEVFEVLRLAEHIRDQDRLLPP